LIDWKCELLGLVRFRILFSSLFVYLGGLVCVARSGCGEMDGDGYRGAIIELLSRLKRYFHRARKVNFDRELGLDLNRNWTKFYTLNPSPDPKHQNT
jgi:hypothetical protein